MAHSLPSGEGSEERGKVVVIDFGEGKLLALDEVLQEVVSLDVEMVDSLVHSLDSALGGADEVLVCHDLVDKLLLGKLVQYFLRVSFIVLPLLEVDCERMVETVEDKPSVLFDSLSGSYPVLPLVEGLGNDVKVSVLEEQSNHCLLHVGSLLLRLLTQILVDLFRAIT